MRPNENVTVWHDTPRPMQGIGAGGRLLADRPSAAGDGERRGERDVEDFTVGGRRAQTVGGAAGDRHAVRVGEHDRLAAPDAERDRSRQHDQLAELGVVRDRTVAVGQATSSRSRDSGPG